jgi:hypothetical protein
MTPTIRAIAAFALALTTVLVFAGSAPALADSEADFTVTMNTSDAVDGNSDLAVDVTVTNEGNASDEQEITLTDGNGNTLNSTTVALDAGNSTTVTLTWENVPVPEASPAPDYERTITPKVSSANDADSTVVTVRWSYFAIESLEPTSKTIVSGNSFNLSTTVRNVGTLDGTEDVTLLVDGTTYASKSGVTIPAEGSTDLAFSNVQPGLSPGTYSYTVKTPEETVSGTLTVLKAAQFTVTALDAVRRNGTVTVDTTVRNDESIAAQQPVVFDVDGQEIDRQNVSLAPGETTDLTFTYDPESVPLTARVQTELDSDSMQVGTVEVSSIAGSYADETVTVTTVITNQDPAGTDQTVAFEVDGEQVETQEVFLSPNSQAELTFTYDPESLPVNVTALTDIDAASINVPNATLEAGPTVEGVSPDRLDVDDSVNVTYTAAGVNLKEARLRVTGPSGATVLDRAVDPGKKEEYTIDQDALAAYREGQYDVTLFVEDEFGGTDTDTLEDAFAATAVIEEGPSIDKVTPEFVDVDETLFIDYTAVGTNIQSVTLQYQGPNGNTVLEQTVPQGTDQRLEVDPSSTDALAGGTHSLKLVMTDVFGNVETTRVEGAFEVGTEYNPENANFEGTASSVGDGDYVGTAGDFVTVSVSVNELDEAYIIVGGDRSANGEQTSAPFDILHVSGSATFTINTRLVGTDRPSDEVYIPTSGDVTSYAHDLGPDTEPPDSSVFSDLLFQNEDREQIATTLSGYRDAVNAGTQIRPLQPGSNISMVIGGGDSLVVTEEGFPDARYPLDRGTLTLTRPSLENVTTYRLPPGNADEQSVDFESGSAQDLQPGGMEGLASRGIEGGTLTNGDRLLIEAEATGMYGALLDALGSGRFGSGGELIEPREFKKLLNRPEGIELELVHKNPGLNRLKTSVDLFDASLDDVSIGLVPGYENPLQMERFYVLVDTRVLEPFDPQPEGGDKYEVRMTYVRPPDERYRFGRTEGDTLPDPFAPSYQGRHANYYPYLTPGEANVTRTSTFDIEDRFLRYDRTTQDGRPVVPNATATISGETNLFPGGPRPVEMVIDIRESSRRVEISDISVASDGTFSVQTDLSMLEAGADVSIQFWAADQKLDERELAVVDRGNVGGEFQIESLMTDSVVTTNGTVAQMSTVVVNTGVLTDNKTVELLLDGDVVARESLSLVPGESKRLHFEEAMDSIGPGEYTLEVQTPDDTEGRVLVVEEAETTVEVTDITATPTVGNGTAGLAFETTVRNTGTINGTETVELLRDGEVIGERTPRLLAGQDVTYTFADELVGLGPGNYTLTVRTPDDQRTVEVRIEEPAAVFDLRRVNVTTTVEQGATISPTAVVNNTGTVAGDGPVTLAVDGTEVDNVSVSLPPGGNETVQFETAIDSEPGTYTLRIQTPDDTVTRELVVEAGANNETQADGGQTDEDDDTESQDRDDEPPDDDSEGESEGSSPAVFVGSRRAALVGGTAVVAGVHVLGYWV